jgi:hypothetical protein
MPYALAIILIFILVTLLLPKLATVNPSTAANGARRTLGGTLMGMAAFTALRGLLPLAVPLFLVGLAIFGAQGAFRKANKDKGKTSSVRTSMLDMSLDHDTGEMDGEVLSGRFEGSKLSSLKLEDLVELLRDCVAANDRSDSLLMAYMDRAHPDWRGQGGGQQAGAGPASGTGAMSRAEALEVLGLREGASDAAIRKAYRELMKKHHPDQGGSAWFAARINEARNVLLGSGKG